VRRRNEADAGALQARRPSACLDRLRASAACEPGAALPAEEIAALAAVAAPPPADGLPPRPRSVLRVESSLGPLACKRWRDARGAAAAEREWRTAVALRAAGVAVAEPVGRSRATARGGSPLLLTRWIEDGRTLAAWWEAERDAAARRALARRVGELVGALHRARLAHRDLHPANVIVDGVGAPWLVDLGRARRAGAATRAADWHALHHSFACRARAVDRLRALAASGQLPRERTRRHAFLRRLERAAEQSRQRFLRHHEQRCDGRGRAFRPLAWPTARGVARRDAPAPLVAWFEQRLGGARRLAALRGEAGLLAAAGARPIHVTRDSELWRLEVAGRAWAVKWFDDRGTLRRALRGSRARRAWRNAFRLRMADVATPAAQLLLEERSLARRPQSVLVTEFLDGATMLHHHVGRAGQAAASALAAAARLVARLHDEGLSQRDLKAENVLVAADGSVALVDLDGIARRVLDLPRVARDLARLNASFRDRGEAMTRVRCDFLATYRAARRLHRPPRDALATAIVHLTERKWQQATTAPR